MTATKTKQRLARQRIDGISIGILMQIEDGLPKVVFPENLADEAVVARSTVQLDRSDVGQEVALSFENGNPGAPIILGKVMKSMPDTIQTERAEIEIDGKTESLDLAAQKRITLRCGKASITLTREGKVLIKGAYVSSRSTGANRIKGGSVHLN